MEKKGFFERNIRYIFPLPAMIFVIVLMVFPVCYTFLLSFTDWTLTRGGDPEFVFLDSYIKVLKEPRFLDAIGRTLYFTFGAVAVETVLGTAIALILDKSFIGKGFVKTCLLLPLVATPVAVGIVWELFYDPTIGFLNYILSVLGLPQSGWVSDASTVMPSLILVDVWQWTPMITLIVLAGLAGLSREPFESAMIDGANSMQILFHEFVELGFVGFRRAHIRLHVPRAFHHEDILRRRARRVQRVAHIRGRELIACSVYEKYRHARHRDGFHRARAEIVFRFLFREKLRYMQYREGRELVYLLDLIYEYVPGAGITRIFDNSFYVIGKVFRRREHRGGGSRRTTVYEYFRFRVFSHYRGDPHLEVLRFEGAESEILSFGLPSRAVGNKEKIKALGSPVITELPAIDIRGRSEAGHAYHGGFGAFLRVIPSRKLQPVFGLHAHPLERHLLELFGFPLDKFPVFRKIGSQSAEYGSLTQIVVVVATAHEGSERHVPEQKEYPHYHRTSNYQTGDYDAYYAAYFHLRGPPEFEFLILYYNFFAIL